MATGFALQRDTVNQDPGYKTLFERVTNKTGGEKKSLNWYRSAVKQEASSFPPKIVHLHTVSLTTKYYY